MKRRTLLKLLSLLPFAGPVITKALATSGHKPAQAYAPYLPTDFPKWNKAIDGLEDAGKWALDIERSLLPQHMMFPRVGQVWETVRNCQVAFHVPLQVDFAQADASGLLKDAAGTFVSANRALLVRGGMADLRQGEKVRILDVDSPKPLCVSFLPLRYQELHENIVPKQIRNLSGYHGYTLQVRTAWTIADFSKETCQTYFNEAFRLIQDSA